jgi:heptosyltransferase II
MEHRTLIIKLGGLGDVLRTTCLLRAITGQIYWLTSVSALPLLKNNPLIRESFSVNNWEKVKDTYFNTVINLDEDITACKIAKSIKAEKFYGLFISSNSIRYTPSRLFDMGLTSKYGIEKANKLKKENNASYPELLYEVIGKKFSGEEYVLELTEREKMFGKDFIRKHNLESKQVIGINTGEDNRWQFKKWHLDATVRLINLMKKNYSLILLGGPGEAERNREIINKTAIADAGCGNSLREFASIINQCSLVISSDSLAMHVAIALKKKAIVFFGPTSSSEINLYNRGTKVIPDIGCLVCYKKTCDIKPNCMDLISPEMIINAAKKLI